jgi:hypothetical protein
MIQETYCSFEVSKLLKEKGFNESIRCWYDNLQDFHEEGVRMRNTDCIPPTIMCPTHQMAMAWLREVHKLHIGIDRGPNGYHITIVTVPLGVVKYITREIVGTTYVDSYEEAVEAALKYSLENLI